MKQPGPPLPVFEGIDAPTTTPVPDVYFDQLFPTLGKGPLKVLLYLVRRTFGFKKDGDHVSLSQICTGIRRHDGRVVDRGTGLTRTSAAAAIRELEARRVIVATRGTTGNGDAAVTHYALRFRERLSVADILTHPPARDAGQFPGIDSPNTTPVPDIYFDQLLPDLGLAEWRLLLYIVRRTLGFKKLADAISFDQFASGIVTRAGVRLDCGAGLARSAVNDAITSLITRNVIVRQHVRDAHAGDGTSIYALTMKEAALSSLRASLSLAPGATTTPALTSPRVEEARGNLGVALVDHHGTRRDSPPGVAHLDYHGVDVRDYPPDHLCRPGFPPEQSSGDEGVQRKDHQGVALVNHGEYARTTTRGTEAALPLVQLAYPQETEQQETEQQDEERDARASVTDLLVQRIAADLGLAHLAGPYSARITRLGQERSLDGFALCSRMMTAWKVTRIKLRQHALTQDNSAMAYFFSVLSATSDASAAQLADSESDSDGMPMQAPHFVAQVRASVGTLPPQETWERVLSGCADTMTPSNFTRWLARTALIEESDALVVAVADPFQRDWLTTRLYAALTRTAQLLGENRPLRFVAADELDADIQ